MQCSTSLAISDTNTYSCEAGGIDDAHTVNGGSQKRSMHRLLVVSVVLLLVLVQLVLAPLLVLQVLVLLFFCNTSVRTTAISFPGVSPGQLDLGYYASRQLAE